MINENLNKMLDAVISQARFMSAIKEDSKFLLENLLALNKSVVSEMLEQYRSEKGPVNQLRAYCASLLLQNIGITEAVLEDKKLRISEEYEKDVFRAWKNPFSIFYPFYIKAEGVNSRELIEKILDKVFSSLNTDGDLSFKLVDFNGSRQLGSDRLWFAIYNSSHQSQKTAQQLFLEINASGVFASRYDRVKNEHKEQIRFNADNFDVDELINFYRKYLGEIRDDVFDEFADYVQSRKVFKISHGPGPISDAHYQELLSLNAIVINEATNPIGTSSNSQYNDFMEANIGDYFYLCRGNRRIELVGVIKSEAEICEIQELGSEGWYQRSYNVIAIAAANDGYKGESKKWWLPSFNSTFREIPRSDFSLANREIFIPFFGREIYNMMLDGSARDLGRTETKRELNVFNADDFIISNDRVDPILGVDKLAAKFGGVIENLENNKGQMLGVFGPWGRGKTYFVEQLCKYLKINYETAESEKISDFYFVKFHAWKYQDTEAIWAYLYEQIADSYYTHKDKEKWRYPTQSMLLRHLYKYIWFPIRKKINEIILLFRLNFKRHGYGDIIRLLLSAVFLFCVIPVIKGYVVENYKYIIYLLYTVVSSIGLVSLINIIYKSYKVGKKGRRVVEKYTEKPTYKQLLGVQAEIQNELKYLLQAWVPINVIRRVWKKGIGNKIWQFLYKTKIGEWNFLRSQRIKFYEASEVSRGKRVLLFVDDIDRCQEDQIIKVVDALRVLLEDDEISKRLVVLSAIDERILSRAILWKYKDVLEVDKKFNSGKNDTNLDPQKLLKEYLDKLFISGIKLSPLDEDDQQKILANYAQSFLEPEEIYAETQNRDSDLEDEPVVFRQGGIRGPDDFEAEIDFEDEEQVKRIDYLISRSELNWIHKMIHDKDVSATPRQLRIVMYRYMFAKSLVIEFLGRSRINTIWSEYIINEIVQKSFDVNYKFDKQKLDETSNIDEATKIFTPKVIEMVVPY